MRPITALICAIAIVVLGMWISGKVAPEIERIETMIGAEQRAATLDCKVQGKDWVVNEDKETNTATVECKE